MPETSKQGPATVYLVGAGPGDPGLITLRAVECLGRADLILYDYLVNFALLEHASPTAELIGLGHHATGRNLTPDQIVERTIEAAQAGKTVVRLKSGDPLIFGRGGDEADALREAGIRYEIVPGITSGLAVAALTEIPITHHEDASAVAIITGRERDEKTESHLDSEALARFPGTLVFYMGVRRAEQWSRALIDNGKSPQTPVAIVCWCSRAQQQTIRCTLETAATVIGERGLRPPAIIIVGKVVDHAPSISWFVERPLFGTRVLVAGSPSTAQRLRNHLAELGADVIKQPAIQIADPSDWTPVDTAQDMIEQYDWLVFTSGNAVEHFMERLFARGLDVRRLGRVKLAAAGSGTADRLARYHLQADHHPEKFVPETLARELAGEANGGRFLLPRAGLDRSELVEALERAGSNVDQVVVYRRVDVAEPSPDVAMALSSDEIDWVTVTSGATAQSLVRLYGDALRHARLASISPMTSAALRELGFEPAVEASPHNRKALVDAMLRQLGRSGG